MMKNILICIILGILVSVSNSCKSKKPIEIKLDYFQERNIKLNVNINDIKLKLKDISEYAEMREPVDKVFLFEDYFHVSNDSVLVENILNVDGDYLYSIGSDFQTTDSLLYVACKKEIFEKYTFVKVKVPNSNTIHSRYRGEEFELNIYELKRQDVYSLSVMFTFPYKE